MAVTIVKRPNERVIPAYKDTVIVLGDIYALANFVSNYRYILSILIGTETITLKAAPNKEGRGVFNISKIVQDYLQTDKADFADSLKSIHKIDKYSKNKNNLIQVHLFGNAEYDIGAGLQTQYSNTIIATTSGYRFWNGCSEHSEGLTFDYTPYILDGTSKELLTTFDAAVDRKARLTDYGNITFFRGQFTDLDGTNNSSDVDRFNIIFYDASDSVLLDTTVTNSASNGGTAVNGVNQTEKGLLYFGAYPQNLQDNTGLSYPAGTSYYTVQAENTSGTVLSKIYTFRIEEADCKGYETIRLTWLNRLGGWDYYNFTKKSVRTTNIKRSPYKANYGSWQATTYDYASFEGGTRNFNVKATEIIEANTDFISELEATGLEELFTSPEVQMQNAAGNFEPVVVTENSYTKQTTANDLLKQYVISIEKGHAKRVQNL